jgi:hypothetical protein
VAYEREILGEQGKQLCGVTALSEKILLQPLSLSPRGRPNDLSMMLVEQELCGGEEMKKEAPHSP